MNPPFALLRARVQPEASADTAAEWVALNDAGQILARGTDPIASLPPAEALELVIPASRVAPHRLEIAASNSRFEAALVRQALEDRVLGDLDKSVIVTGERQGKQLTVWVADREWLGELVSQASQRGKLPTRLTPEQALLAPGELAQGVSGWIFRTANDECGLLPARELALAIGGEDLQENADLLATAPQAARVNLLSGLPRLSRAAAGFSPALFKPAAILLIVAALVYLFSQALVLHQLSAQEAGLRQAIRQNFAAARPGVPIVDPILQWRQSQGKGSNDSTDALDALAGFAAQSGISLKPQRIEVDDNRIRLTLTTADATALRNALQQKNIVFESGSTDNGLSQITINQKAGGKS